MKHLGAFRYAAACGSMCMVGACQAPGARVSASESPPWQPTASIQELMQSVVDPSADGVWNSVETVATAAGESTRQPRTADEWQDVRHAAITLAESANLLVIEGRNVGAQDFPAEAAGALDSAQIRQLVADRRQSFDAFAAALRMAAMTAVSAVDARDPSQLVSAGGAIDRVCEGCHLTFWYPNQVIPRLPNSIPRPAALLEPTRAPSMDVVSASPLLHRFAQSIVQKAAATSPAGSP